MKRIDKKVLILLMVGYSLLLSYWMIFGFGRTARTEYMYNLKPFLTISDFLQIDKFNSNIWIINLIGNVGVFMPFGILLPLIFQTRIVNSFIIFFSGLFILESLQFLSRRGSFDIDDFILNSIGFIIGYGIFKVLKLYLNKRSSIA